MHSPVRLCNCVVMVYMCYVMTLSPRRKKPQFIVDLFVNNNMFFANIRICGALFVFIEPTSLTSLFKGFQETKIMTQIQLEIYFLWTWARSQPRDQILMEASVSTACKREGQLSITNLSGLDTGDCTSHRSRQECISKHEPRIAVSLWRVLNKPFNFFPLWLLICKIRIKKKLSDIFQH